jgi:hypothetical protein
MPRKPGKGAKGVGDNTPRKHRRTGNSKLANLKAAWQPGQSGNPAGRPKGSRNHLSEMFLDEFCQLYELDSGKSLRWMQMNDPVAFVKAIIAVIPKQAIVDVNMQPVYVIADRALSADEWAAKYADPEPPARVEPPRRPTKRPR